MSTQRRQTLGSLSSSTLNSKRISLGGTHASKLMTNKSTARKSMSGYNHTSNDKENYSSIMKNSNNTRKSISNINMSSNNTDKRKSLGNTRLSIVPSQPITSSNNNNKLNESRMSLTGRRSSAYGSKPAPSQIPTRPTINDKTVMKHMIQKLILYLAQHSYNKPLSPKILLQPSTNDFKSIIEFLFSQIDSNISFSMDNTVFADELLTLLKYIKYPYVISKSKFQTISASHCWPEFLYMLCFLVEQIELSGNQSNAEQMKKNNFFEYDSTEFFIDEYYEFMNGSDIDDTNNDALIQRLQNRFNNIQHDIKNQLSTIQSDNISMTQRITQLTDKHISLVNKQEQYNNIRSAINDITYQYNEMVQTKSNLMNEITQLQQLESNVNHDINALTESIDLLTQRIHAQPYSMQQIESMRNSIRQSDEQIAQLQLNYSHGVNEIDTIESNIRSSLDLLEKHIVEYNNLGKQIEILPQHAKYSDNRELTIQLVNDTQHIINIDLKQLVKPLLLSLHQKFRSKISDIQYECNTLNDNKKLLDEKYNDQQERIDSLQQRLQKIELNVANEKQSMNAQLKQAVALVESNEIELNTMKNKQITQLSNILYTTENQYTQLCHKLNSVQSTHQQQYNTLCNEINHCIDNIVQHKENVVNRLNDVLQHGENTLNNIKQLHCTAVA